MTELKFVLVAAGIHARRDSIPWDMYYRALQNALELFFIAVLLRSTKCFNVMFLKTISCSENVTSKSL